MEKIVDVYINCLEFPCDISENERLTGRILVGEDNFFEGIAKNIREKRHYFIFGNIAEDGIQLIRCSEDDKDIPRIIDATRKEHTYEGDFKAKNMYTLIPLGESVVSLIPAEVTRNETEWERKQIQTGIIRMKHRLGEVGNQAHESFEYTRLYQPTEKKIQKIQNI